MLKSIDVDTLVLNDTKKYFEGLIMGKKIKDLFKKCDCNKGCCCQKDSCCQNDCKCKEMCSRIQDVVGKTVTKTIPDAAVTLLDKVTEYIKEQGWYKHLCTINEHKIEVGKNCFRCGLYWQGIVHDLSKYSPAEFLVGAKYYQGTRSPNEAEREAVGYTSSWLHHKGRNKHHLEYWIDYDLDKRDGSMTGMKMPDNYIIEMFCDRVAASKIYKGDKYTDRSALDYYLNGKSKGAMHPYVRRKIEMLLRMLADRGEEETFAYAKRYLKAYKMYLKRQKYKAKMEKRLDASYAKKRDKVTAKIKDKFSLKKEKKYARRQKADMKKLRKYR